MSNAKVTIREWINRVSSENPDRSFFIDESKEVAGIEHDGKIVPVAFRGIDGFIYAYRPVLVDGQPLTHAWESAK